MSDLPKCCHRGQQFSLWSEDVYFACRSNRLVHDGSVSANVCHRIVEQSDGSILHEYCPYADRPNLTDAELADLRKKPQPLWPADLPCEHRTKMIDTVLVSENCGGCRDQDITASVYRCSVHERCVIQAVVAATETQPQRCVACADCESPKQMTVTKTKPRIFPCVHRGDFTGSNPTPLVECRSLEFDHEFEIPMSTCWGCEFARTTSEPPCRFRGQIVGAVREHILHACAIHERCTISADVADDNGKAIVRCTNCEERELMPTRQRAVVPEKRKLIKPVSIKGMVRGRQNQPADYLQDSMVNQSVFLCTGGPSMNEIDLSLFDRRGIAIAAVNQIGSTHVRPHFWFSCDEPSHFQRAIWLDPAIMKFAASEWWKNRERGPRSRNANGAWQTDLVPIRDFPNVFVYERSDKWSPEHFLTMRGVCWNTHALTSSGKKSVLLVAIRLLYWLGFRTIYLLGTDFQMTAEQQYAFDQGKGPNSVATNNKTFRCLNESFVQMTQHFADHGLTVLNCTPGGKLEAFPRMSLETAVATALRDFPDNPCDVGGLYRNK